MNSVLKTDSISCLFTLLDSEQKSTNAVCLYIVVISPTDNNTVIDFSCLMSRVSLICLRVSVSYITGHVAKDSLLHNTYVSTMQLNDVFDIFFVVPVNV